MLTQTQLKELATSKNTYIPVVCADGSVSVFASPILKDEDVESIQRFALKLAPEIFIIDAHVLCPLRVSLKDSQLDLLVELFQDVDYIPLKKANLDPATCRRLMSHVSKELLNSVSSAVKHYYESSEVHKNPQKIDNKHRTLLSMFAPKDNSQATLEDIYKSAEALCKKLNHTASEIPIVEHPQIKEHIKKRSNPTPVEPTSESVDIQIQGPESEAKAKEIEKLNAEIKTLSEQLALTEQVLKDSGDAISKLKRNNLYAGALAGAASMYLSVDYLDRDKKSSTVGKIAASAIGFTLGLIPYTRYATIAAAPFIADKLLASGTLSSKKEPQEQKNIEIEK